MYRKQFKENNREGFLINHKNLIKLTGYLICCGFLFSCSATVPDLPSDNIRHLSRPDEPQVSQNIPDIVKPLPLLSEPQAQPEPELFSLIAQGQQVRAILFAMARDASINIDIHPEITGQVSINAIDQTLPQILQRISRQVDLRWSFDINGTLLVEPDSPYWHVYRIDYVNVERTATTMVNVSNSLVSVGDQNQTEGNNSSATLSQTSTNSFWNTLTDNLNAILSNNLGESESSESETFESVVANPESGVINIKANGRQHEEIATFLNLIQYRSLQEVMIEATIVEVSLSDNYQTGVDWSAMSGEVSFQQNLLGINLEDPPTSILTIDGNDVTSTVRMLSQFGDLRVLSSPKIMALNNQAAMLRVVDNTVYFSIDVEPSIVSNGIVTPATYSSTIHTVPVGFVMTVTPQIGDNNQVTLNVRPTISRIVSFVEDPNPILAREGVKNEVPVIQVREMESILKVFSGQIAVLGGLMQDSLEQNTTGVPLISRIPGIRNLFSARDDTTKKTELIIFIRPVIISQPSLNGDFEEYQQFLPVSTTDFFEQNSNAQPLN